MPKSRFHRNTAHLVLPDLRDALSRLLRTVLLLGASLLTAAVEKGPAAKPERPAQTDPASERLLAQCLRASGGAEAYAALEAVYATGLIEEAGQVRQFELLETRSGKRHLVYRWRRLGRDHEQHYAFDGEAAWQRQLKPTLEVPKTYGGPEGQHFSRQRWLLQPFADPLREAYVFDYRGKAQVAGRSAFLAVGYAPDAVRSWFYFDSERFLLVRWGGRSRIGDAAEYLDYRCSRFEAHGGVLLPKEITLLAENEPFGTIEFSHIRINPPFDPAMFQRPPDGIPVLRQRPKD